MIEPSKFAAGDSLTWTRTLSDYPASESYVLHYALFNAGSSITLDSTAEGDDHLIDIASTVTSKWVAGRYDWSAFITGPAGFKKSLFTGVITITPDLTAAPYDGRTHAQKMLEAIEAFLEKRASADEMDLVKGQYSERAIERDPNILRVARKEYQAEVNKEGRDAARCRGEKVSSNTKIKFVR